MQPTGDDSASSPVHVLLFDAFGGGGVARTVVNLANHLAESRRVEVISLFRGRTEPRFAVDPRVCVTVLQGGDEPLSGRRETLAGRRTSLRPAPGEPRMSRLTDRLLRTKLRSLPPGVLLTTRPSLHLAAARLAPRHLVTVGQDHSNFTTRFDNPLQREVLRWAVPRLDAFAVLTADDAADYRGAFPDARTLIRFVPNALPWPVSGDPAPLESKIVVSAGRLDQGKGHTRMVRAFEPVARRHPDWQLHIYGAGPEHGALRSLVTELGLEEQVRLMGYTADVRKALSEAAVFALTSHREGFSMVLLEAMSVGVPPVAMDCPRGPRQLVRDGSNGRLVPDGDGPGFTAALLSLVENAELRRTLGSRAHEDARAYEIARVGAAWDLLFAEATARRHG